MDYRVGLILLILGATFTCQAAEQKSSSEFGGGKQKWGFVDVRKGAHIFWWLHYTTAPNLTSPTDRPLAIWLQGGPGASSTGYGNFEEIGPLDLDLNQRNYTWVNDMNVLFIDSPVGSGFSYVDDDTYLTADNLQVAKDLIELLRGFYVAVPEFKSVPLHIFAESYGGKVAVEFAYFLNQEIENKTIESNLKSVTSIDGWISPIDSMLSWAPFLLHMGFVDQAGHDAIHKQTINTKKALDSGKFESATDLWGRTEVVVLQKTRGIDFYNVLRHQTSEKYNSKLRAIKANINDAMYRTLVEYDEYDRDSILEKLMTGPVSQALNISSNIVWGSQSYQTFATLSKEFMKPVIHIVERLLNETSIEVNIITGQLDLIVATPGTIEWVKKVKWPGASAFSDSKRKIIGVNNVLEGYYKKRNNFALYWINRSGHMVPTDNPAAMDFILQKVTKYKPCKSNYQLLTDDKVLIK